MIDLIWKNRVMDYVINIITYEQFIITKSHTSAILNACHKHKKIDEKDFWQSYNLSLKFWAAWKLLVSLAFTCNDLCHLFVCLLLFFYEKKFQKVAEEVARLHDEFYTNKTLQEMAKVSTLYKLDSKYYSDSDLVDTLPSDMEFNR